LIRHPLIIAPIGAQRQALLTERLRYLLFWTTTALRSFPVFGLRSPGEEYRFSVPISTPPGLKISVKWHSYRQLK